MSFPYLGCLNIIRTIARRILYFASFALSNVLKEITPKILHGVFTTRS